MAGRPRLVHRPWFVATASTTTASYLRLVEMTTRWREVFDDDVVAALARGEALIGVFWHQRALGIPALWRRVQHRAGVRGSVEAVVSHHGDGELIARTLARLEVGQIRGSTNRGGDRVVRQAVKALADGRSLAIVVDGPRGPHGHVHPGALVIAKVTGRPLVPITFAVARGVQARSWDRMLVPLPFGRGAFHVGAPLHVDATAGRAALDGARADLAERLRALNADADRPYGPAR